jgi:hypothetical protein
MELSTGSMVPGQALPEQLPLALQKVHDSTVASSQSTSSAPHPQSQAWSP